MYLFCFPFFFLWVRLHGFCVHLYMLFQPWMLFFLLFIILTAVWLLLLGSDFWLQATTLIGWQREERETLHCLYIGDVYPDQCSRVLTQLNAALSVWLVYSTSCHEMSLSVKKLQQLRQSTERLLHCLLGCWFVAAKCYAQSLNLSFCCSKPKMFGIFYQLTRLCSYYISTGCRSVDVYCLSCSLFNWLLNKKRSQKVMGL